MKLDDLLARVTKENIHPEIGIGQVNVIKGLQADISGLRKASDAVLSLYIKEIDVLTKEKLIAIRRMRAILTGHERREA